MTSRCARLAMVAVILLTGAPAVARLPVLPPLPPGMPTQGAWSAEGGLDADRGTLSDIDARGTAAERDEDIGTGKLADHDDARDAESGDAPEANGTSSRNPDETAGRRAPERASDDGANRLEGPPVPLGPPQRMSDGMQRHGGREDGDGKPITLHFRDARLADVFDAFARFTGLNIVASGRVQGNVSLFLDAVPWRSAFDTLLDANGLAMIRRDNVIWVAPVAELAARERLRFEAHARAADLEPLASRTFALRYPRAEDVQRLLTASGSQRVLSKRGAAMADARTNLLFVTDLEARLAQVAELVAAIDKPSRQVLIEARIVEGVRGFSRDLGARLSVRGPGRAASDDVIGFSGDRNGLVHDLSAQALAGFDAATAGLTLFAARATRLVTAELSALEAEGRGEIVSSPRIVTADRMKAVVEQGKELPYQAKVRNGVSGIQFRRATLKLEVEPQITPNGRVILDLDIAKDSVGEATAAGLAIDTKHVRTRVEVEDGGTVSIGGIYENRDRDDVTRVPLLGKIPVLGAFFRHRTQREHASELVVFITPRIVSID
jgi:type IV pilus assembly protein PilQ